MHQQFGQQITQRLNIPFFSTLFALVLLMAPAAFAQQVFSGAGNVDATRALNAFRVAIGGADNGQAGPQADGRREINWDGVKLDGTDFNGNTKVIVPNKVTAIPGNRFQARGLIYTGFTAVSNDGFASLNPRVAGQFPAFSPANTFSAIQGTQIEANFVLPSAPTEKPVPAATRGFGVIFLDVEQANSSSIEYFNGTVSLGKFFVPPAQSGQAEFLGVLFNAPIVTRVIITAGNAQVFNISNGKITSDASDRSIDQAVTDDFSYAEPVSLTAPNAAVAFSANNKAGATNALNAFRAAIGGADNGQAGLQAGGRREINWDGVKLDGTDFNGLTIVIVPNKVTAIPGNRFQARGLIYTGFTAVSNDGFASVNPLIAGQFPAFSPANTFSSILSTQVEVNFVLASAPMTTPVPAATRGFGVIFVDVEQARSSSIEYFNGNVSLGKFFVPPGQNAQTGFLGVLFNAPIVTRAVITAGNTPVFDLRNPGRRVQVDRAAMDDFVYAEPVDATRP